MKSATPIAEPRWHRLVLLSACLHCVIWAGFILAMPVLSAKIYGFAQPPHDLHLWQGTGLFIFLLGIGYGLAARDPVQHWGLVMIGLLAKVIGSAGMCFAVYQGQVSSRVLFLLPVNDVVWWLPFWLIVCNGIRQSRARNADRRG